MVSDLEDHASFYLLLRDEADIDTRIKQNVVFILRETQQFIEISTSSNFISSLKIEDLTNPFGINFKQFYSDVYVPNFPDPEERDPEDFMQEYLHPTYQRSKMAEKAHTHLLLAKVKERVIGGVIADFIGCKNNICFGVIWFLVVAKDTRTRGVGTFLVNKCINMLKRDTAVLGYPYLYGVFDEVNSVSKMTPEQIEIDRRDSMDPAERELFWEKRGFRVVDINYSQLAVAPGMKPVDYVNLRVHPLAEKWINSESMQSSELSIILQGLFKYLGKGINIDRDLTAQRILREVQSKGQVSILM